jgi:hypothetical protein
MVVRICSIALVLVVASTAPAQTILRSFFGGSAMAEVGRYGRAHGIGDVDNDGLADFVYMSREQSPFGVGLARLVYGSAAAAPRSTWGQAGGFGDTGGARGDVDGDGVRDYIVGDFYGGPNGEGAITAYSGANGNTLRSVAGNTQGDWFVACCLADCNGDGYADLVGGSSSALQSPGVWRALMKAVSGRDGSLLWEKWGPGFFCEQMENLGDVNNDGCEDFATGSTASSTIHSGSDGTVLRGGAGITAAGDIDQDGVSDYLEFHAAGSSGPGSVLVVSGASGATIRQHVGFWPGEEFGRSRCANFHYDDDGIPDYAIRAARIIPFQFGVYNGRLDFFSGATGALLNTWISGPREGLGSLDVAGDIDGDGGAELLFGAWGSLASSFYNGGVLYVLKVRNGPAGNFREYGKGCEGSNLKLITAGASGLPQLGRSFSLRVRAAAANNFAFAAVGNPSTIDLTVLGAPGCFAHILPYWILPVATDAVGRGAVGIAVPTTPSLIGARLDSQWFTLDPAANQLGIVTSTAVAIVLGP